jgi:photosystem II stability/assembly factor-like uncharacterized protein
MRRSFLSLLIILAFAGYARAQDKTKIDPHWINLSDGIVKKFEAEGKKLDWPGETAGVTVDPATGDAFMIVTGQGIWKSTDAGKTFNRVDGGKIGGRCETSYALNVDPAGKRIACFMLDGKCGWTSDAGKTWTGFTDVGRNWDYAAVDWSAADPQHIFAALHESGGQVMTSSDGGKTWNKLFKEAEFDKSGGLGVFDAKTLVYTQKGKGIQRSTDFGQTWTKVDDREPIGRVVQVLGGTGYWLTKEGLLVSQDKGATWKPQGKAAEGASIGPMLDPKNEKRMVVAGVKGIYQTTDGGETWKTIAGAYPAGFDFPKHGWYTTTAWDPVHDVIYISKMGKPAYRWEKEKP